MQPLPPNYARFQSTLVPVLCPGWDLGVCDHFLTLTGPLCLSPVYGRGFSLEREALSTLVYGENFSLYRHVKTNALTPHKNHDVNGQLQSLLSDMIKVEPPKDNKCHEKVDDNRTGQNAEDGGEALDNEDSWDDEDDEDIWDQEHLDDIWSDKDEEDMCYISPALWVEMLAEDEARRLEDDMIDAGYCDEDDDMSSGSEESK